MVKCNFLLKTIRKYCIECVGNSSSEVDECSALQCNLRSYRNLKEQVKTDESDSYTILNVIKKHCLNCMCGSAHEVKLCPSSQCLLFEFRNIGMLSNRKDFNNNTLNKKFKGAEGHHINKNDIIYIPKELHKSILHSVTQDKNMEEINKLAIEYLFDNEMEV